jgi:hypothetical protein
VYSKESPVAGPGKRQKTQVLFSHYNIKDLPITIRYPGTTIPKSNKASLALSVVVFIKIEDQGK